MNKDMRKRFMEAKRYQKMALKALIPENERKHFEVIGNELKEMMMEGFFELAKEYAYTHGTCDKYESDEDLNDKKCNENKSENQNQGKDVKVKKVTIGG